MIKRHTALVLITGMLLFLFPFRAQAADLEVSAGAAVLIEPMTGRVLFEKNKSERRSMASTTKIMTALLALESGRLDEVVTVTGRMVRVEGTSMGLKAGDKVTLSALVNGMMLSSGNDAANAVAVFLGEDQAGFAAMMNARAKEIGMAGTNFVTPSGLDDEEHYTTAYDMALLGAEAMKNPAFKEMVSAPSAQVEIEDPPRTRTFSNHNRLLREYEGANGIKTGFTKKSGRCLVSSAERDGVSLIAVTLHASSDWKDHKAMLDYGFEQLTVTPVAANEIPASLPVTGGVEDSVPITSGQAAIPLVKGDAAEIRCVTTLGAFLYAPVERGQEIGFHTIYYGEKAALKVPITAGAAVAAARPEKPSFFNRMLENARFLYNLTFE